MRIDAHQHFWRYSPAEYGWIDEGMAQLRRDFLPEHLLPIRSGCGIDGTIAVQARQSLAETQWLLQLASRFPWIRGVVGWVDLCSPLCGHQLDAFARDPRLVGIRHVLQAEPDDYSARPEFRRGIAVLEQRKLVYDVLVYHPQLPAALALCRQFPGTTFVLDHLGKPPARSGERAPWQRELRELAALPNVHCKLSGLVTEADPAQWTRESLRPWFAAAIEAFGPERLMFGSDWPVCLLASAYDRWLGTVEHWLAGCSAKDRAAVLGGTAMRVYGLPGEANADD